MVSLRFPAHTCRSTGVGIADSAMPYTYRSISPDTRIRNGKDFHSPIKSRNFVLTVFLDGVKAPPSVCFLVGFGQKPSQPKDRYRLYRDFRTQIPSVPVYLFALHFRHEVLHRERAASTWRPFSSRPPRTFAAGLCLHHASQSTTVIPWRLGWPLFISERNLFFLKRTLFHTEIECAFHFRTERIAIIHSRHFVSRVAVTRLQLFRIKLSFL